MKWTTITVFDIIQEVKVLNDAIQNNLEHNDYNYGSSMAVLDLLIE